MNLEDFAKDIENALELGTIPVDADYRSLEGWSSMNALILIALIDSDYGVTLTGAELASCKTITDLFHVVSSKS